MINIPGEDSLHLDCYQKA